MEAGFMRKVFYLGNQYKPYNQRRFIIISCLICRIKIKISNSRLQCNVLLYGDMNNEDMGYAVGFDDGIFGAFSRLEDILYRNSRLDTDSTDIILDDKKLSPAEKASC